MTNLDSILKSRDTTLLTKVCLVKAMVFPVVMYRYECWTIKKALLLLYQWRIDAFELWCWRRLLRVPWTARRSNQSILKEINPEYTLEGLMLKLHTMMWRAKSLEKTLILGKIEAAEEGDSRGWDGWIWITNSMDMSLSKPWDIMKGREAWKTAVYGLQRVRHDWATKQQCHCKFS